MVIPDAEIQSFASIVVCGSCLWIALVLFGVSLFYRKTEGDNDG